MIEREFDRRVPCNGCTACCRDQIVVLVEEDGDPGQYDTIPLEGAGDDRLRQLASRPDGSCVYLGDQGCTIYDRRPAMCRSFDCRAFAIEMVGLDKAQEMARAGNPVIKAALDRMWSYAGGAGQAGPDGANKQPGRVGPKRERQDG